MFNRPTGAGVACRGLVKGLSERGGIALSAYAVGRGTTSPPVGLPEPVPYRGWPIPARVAFTTWRRLGLPRAEHLLGSPDVVHGTNFAVPPAQAAATVVTVNDLTSIRFPEMCDRASLAYPGLVRDAFCRGALVHVPSSFTRDEVVDLLAIPAERVRVVNWALYPVPPIAVSPASDYLLAVGTIEPRKGYLSLVEAFAEVAEGHRSLRLLIAGAEGWGSELLTKSVDRLGLGERVQRLGYVDDSRRLSLMGGALALVYPSLYEGFGFPPLEAMTLGLPVVASRAGSIPEVVADAALLAEPGDPASLAAAITKVLEDSELRRSLAERGRERARLFTLQRCAAEMEDLYRHARELR
jgi:glycosyltransferase involved in cell wall biosynthesis